MPSGFFALLDDISYLMDDIASAAKITTKKTAAILGDDLAVEAEKTLGTDSSREIPIIISIIKGSLINKLIILPTIFTLSYIAPELIPILLIVGGTYLNFEGIENILGFILKKHKRKKILTEKEKIKSAIVTDFILSLEIVIISMGSVEGKPFIVQVASTTIASLLATAGVYSIVAFIIRMDDMGMFLAREFNGLLKKLGIAMIKLLPITVKFLSFAGTFAMILVGGSIYIHHIEVIKNILNIPIPLANEFITGLIIGSIAYLTKVILTNILSIMHS